MPLVDCKQGTPLWLKMRCASVTSSRVADALSFLKKKSKNGEKGEESQARKNLKSAIIAEHFTGIHQETYVSRAMEFGTENEPFARALYEVNTGSVVDLVGYWTHPLIERAGASPDGIIGDDGLIEIKAPNTTTHLGYINGGEAPEEYQPQMLWQMACTGRKWCDFVSYDPRLPDNLQLFVVHFPRDEERIAEMERGVVAFLAEVDELIEKLSKRTSLVFVSAEVA